MSKPVIISAAVLVTPLVILTACSSGKTPNNSSGNTPNNQTGSSATTSGTAAADSKSLTTQLKTADGRTVANATFDFANGYATVTVETVASGLLSPGFHGLHIHSVGKCEANSVAPKGGAVGDFNSAGGHLQAPGHTGHPASGDLTSLEVRSDGSAKLVTTTDAFTEADLSGPEGSALMIHAGSDNFANIPPRYSENGTPGPDAETMATGDAGKRVACGVIAPASATAGSTTATAVPVPGDTSATTPSASVTSTPASTPTTAPAGG
jgi:Cu-Zn family superoxide dismutase